MRLYHVEFISREFNRVTIQHRLWLIATNTLILFSRCWARLVVREHDGYHLPMMAYMLMYCIKKAFVLVFQRCQLRNF